MEFEGILEYPILELGLSQIYLDEDKLRAVKEWFDPKQVCTYEPLPVHDFGDGRYTLTDGHSRSYVAWAAGLTHIPVIYDRDAIVCEPPGSLMYRFDLEWCRWLHLKMISDLQGRILSHEQYEKMWIARCDRNFQLLKKTTKEEREKIRSKVPGFLLYGAADDLSEFYLEDVNGCLFCYKDGVLFPEV